MGQSPDFPTLEATVMAMAGYRPKGPFPLFIKDLREDTVGWDGAARWRYICVLEHMFHQGGYIPDDLAYLAEISGMNRARNWRETLEKLRYILLKSEKKLGFLTNKRVLLEVEKANKRSGIASTGGKAKAEKKVAVSTAEKVLPTPSPQGSKKEASLSGSQERKPPDKPATPTKEHSDDKPTKHRAKRTRFPADWCLTSKDITYAQGKGYVFPKIEHHGEHFAAYNRKEDKTSANWHQSFITWILHDINRHGPPGTRRTDHGRADEGAGGFAAAAARVAAVMEGRGNEVGNAAEVHGGRNHGGEVDGEDRDRPDHDPPPSEENGPGTDQDERPDEAPEGGPS